MFVVCGWYYFGWWYELGKHSSYKSGFYSFWSNLWVEGKLYSWLHEADRVLNY